MTAPRTTSPAIRVVDIVAGALIALVGLVLGGGMLLYVAQLASLGQGCTEQGCDTTGLNVALIVGAGAIVFGWAITFGLYLVRAIRRRVAFFWPLIGIAVIVAAVYGTTAAAGGWVDGSGLIPQGLGA